MDRLRLGLGCFTIVFFLSSTRGLELNLTKIVSSAANGYACSQLKCYQRVTSRVTTISALQIFNLASNGSLLTFVPPFLLTETPKDPDVIVTDRQFTPSFASLSLQLKNRKDCDKGAFLCELRYSDFKGHKKSEIAVVRARAPDDACSHDVTMAVADLKSTFQQALSTTAQQISQSVSSNAQQISQSVNTNAQQISQSVSSNAQQISQSVDRFMKTVQSECLVPDTLQKREWTLVFRGTAGIARSVYFAYKDGTGIPYYVENGCKQVGSPAYCSNHYRNNAVINNWRGISEVAFAIYKNHQKVKQVIFDGSGSTYMNWFDKSRVKDSSWLDLKTSGSNYFSLLGHQEGKFRRTMFMNVRYGGCPNDMGWFVAIDNTHGHCPWEQNLALPVFKYSYTDTASNWNSATTTADYIAIFVRYFNVP